MRVESLYRYPVKGLSAELLAYTDLEPGQALPWDRAFALAQGESGFDPQHPTFRPKSRFMCLMRNAGIAAIDARFRPEDGNLTLAAHGRVLRDTALEQAGRTRIAAWLTDFLGQEARGIPVFHHVPGHVFGDQRRPVVSLMNQASIAALEGAVGSPRHRLRFRANVYFAGAAPWSEFDWLGRDLRIGTATLRVLERTDRCPATEVNPETAQRDADPVGELRRHFGHADLGVHAEVVAAGRIAPGDPVVLL